VVEIFHQKVEMRMVPDFLRIATIRSKLRVLVRQLLAVCEMQLHGRFPSQRFGYSLIIAFGPTTMDTA